MRRYARVFGRWFVIGAAVITVGYGTALVANGDTDQRPSAAAAPSSSVIHYVVVAGDSWVGIANQYNLSGNDLARQNRTTISTTLQPGNILHIIPGPPPSTTTTTSPATTTTVLPTTTTTSTTLPATTTSTSTSTTTTTTTTVVPTTTTTVPPGSGFTETFIDDEGWRSRWDVDIHHRTEEADNGNPSSTPWAGDHDLSCSAPDIQRQVTAVDHNPDPAIIDRSEQVYRCGTEGGIGNAHMMTSIGDVDGYSTISFSPKQTFAQLHKVCWDQNVTDAGGRAWTEVVIVPTAKVADGDLTHVNPQFESVDEFSKQHNTTTWGAMIHGQYFGLFVFANGVEDRSGENYQLGKDQAGRESRAIRRQHCLFINPNNTVTVQIDQGTNGFYTHTYPGVIPPNVRVIFEQHAYTPDKDGEACRPRGVLTGCRYTWHWDNITIE